MRTVIFNTSCVFLYSVVCRQLGFGDAIRIYTSRHRNSEIFWLDEVHCTSRDRYLSECSFSRWGDVDCPSFEDANVVCNRTSVLPKSFNYNAFSTKITTTK